MSLDILAKAWPYIADGLVMTLILSATCLTIGTLAGFTAGLLRLSPYGIVRVSVAKMCDFIRTIPLLLLIFFIFFGFPSIGWNIAMYPAAVTAFSLWMMANTSEVVRGGIQAVSAEQKRAAMALGLSGAQTLRCVVIPQALPLILPPYVGLCTALIKDTSLAAVIGVVELTGTIQNTVAWTKMPVEFYSLAAALYFAINFLISIAGRFVEYKLKGEA